MVDYKKFLEKSEEEHQIDPIEYSTDYQLRGK